MLQTKVRDVVQEGAVHRRRKRFVLEDHNSAFSHVALMGKHGCEDAVMGKKLRMPKRTDEAAKKKQTAKKAQHGGERTTASARLIGRLLIGGALGQVRRASLGK